MEVNLISSHAVMFTLMIAKVHSVYEIMQWAEEEQEFLQTIERPNRILQNKSVYRRDECMFIYWGLLRILIGDKAWCCEIDLHAGETKPYLTP